MIHFNKSAIDAVSIPKAAVERLLGAPPACAKVYLFGLVRQQADMDQIASELEMKKEQVQEALEYLERLGLVETKAKSGTEISYSVAGEAAPEENLAVYEDAEFNAMLQALFTDRELSYKDYKVFYECIDVYGLPKRVVLMLAEYAITTSRARNRVSVASIREQAKQWSREGIDTIELAQHRMEEGENNAGAAREILRSLKINRLPTDEEEKLYDKWVKEWGFSFGAVKAATAAMTKVQYPNMKYLDGILKNLKKADKLSAKDVGEHFAETEHINENIKELLKVLSAPRLTVSSEYRAKYLKWKNMGFNQDAVAFACAYAVSLGAGNFEYVDKLLVGWSSKKLFGTQQIQDYLQERESKKAKIAQMLERAGIKKPIARGDEDYYDKFIGKYGMADDIVCYAAECAYGLAAPLKAMDKILVRWRDSGVRTLEGAKQENQKFQSYQQGKNGHNMLERNYSLEELRAKIKDPILEMEERDETKSV